MLVNVIRTLLIFVIVVIVLRLLGKRQIGQMQPYELVIIIMISELASVPSENIGIPLLSGILPIIVLLFSGEVMSFISLKSTTARSLICGSPAVLIERGQIMEEQLKKLRLTLSDLLEQLRVKDTPNIADVEFAILETNGQISVILKSQKRPAIPDDFRLATPYEGLPYTLIMDGKLDSKNLQRAQLEQKWLKNELKKAKIDRIEDVFFASYDSSGNLYVQKKQSS
ncbi:MAG: DUF421 domain-containing protein [Peptococcaceae bacterium]|jgi:uncharacterized membrane protein YcaP (DUF421 family)|nr:DUF421 domain-containing protein [Peptococcaceae bacterium]